MHILNTNTTHPFLLESGQNWQRYLKNTLNCWKSIKYWLWKYIWWGPGLALVGPEQGQDQLRVDQTLRARARAGPDRPMDSLTSGLFFSLSPDSVAGIVFQVFQVLGGEKERENKYSLDNLFQSIILFNICSNAPLSSKCTNVSLFSSWLPMSDDLTCPDYKLGDISVGSQDLANRNQDDIYIMCFTVRHWTQFTQTSETGCQKNHPIARYHIFSVFSQYTVFYR